MVERLINCNNTIEIEFLKNLNNYKKNCKYTLPNLVIKLFYYIFETILVYKNNRELSKKKIFLSIECDLGFFLY